MAVLTAMAVKSTPVSEKPVIIVPTVPPMAMHAATISHEYSPRRLLTSR